MIENPTKDLENIPKTYGYILNLNIIITLVISKYTIS